MSQRQGEKRKRGSTRRGKIVFLAGAVWEEGVQYEASRFGE